MNMKQFVVWDLAGEIEMLWENLSSATLPMNNPTWPRLGSYRGRRGGKPEINSLNYEMATILLLPTLRNDTTNISDFVSVMQFESIWVRKGRNLGRLIEVVQPVRFGWVRYVARMEK
jgi:hypothetical protein